MAILFIKFSSNKIHRRKNKNNNKENEDPQNRIMRIKNPNCVYEKIHTKILCCHVVKIETDPTQIKEFYCNNHD